MPPLLMQAGSWGSWIYGGYEFGKKDVVLSLEILQKYGSLMGLKELTTGCFKRIFR